MTISYSSSSTLVSSIMSSQQWMNFPGIRAQLSVRPHYFLFYDSFNYTCSCFELCIGPLSTNPTICRQEKKDMPFKLLLSWGTTVLQNCATNNKYDLLPSLSLQGFCIILMSLAYLHRSCGYFIMPNVHMLHVLENTSRYGIKLMTSHEYTC